MRTSGDLYLNVMGEGKKKSVPLLVLHFQEKKKIDCSATYGERSLFFSDRIE